MAAAEPTSLPPNVPLDDLSQQGIVIYERLKPLLEPAHNGEAIAIHVESGDYAVARFTGTAMRTLRQTRPNGPLVLLRIGSEPEQALAARLFGGQERWTRESPK